MAEKTYRYYKDLPTWAKGIVIVGGVAITGFVLFQLYKTLKEKADKKQAEDFKKEAKKELDILKAQGVKPSYSPSQYESFSSKIVVALDGCGSDEQAVYSVFAAIKNKADLLNLISSFGVRYYQPCLLTDPISRGFDYIGIGQKYGGNLSTWLTYDLDKFEIDRINNMLSSKGIDYKF